MARARRRHRLGRRASPPSLPGGQAHGAVAVRQGFGHAVVYPPSVRSGGPFLARSAPPAGPRRSRRAPPRPAGSRASYSDRLGQTKADTEAGPDDDSGARRSGPRR